MRSLPRAFVPGVPDPLPETILLPEEDYKKFHKVLRLGSGDHVAILAGEGRLVRCSLEGHNARVLEVVYPETEPEVDLTVCLAIAKGDALDTSVRMGAELGVARFIVFPSERTVAVWDAGKLANKLRRLQAISREAAEVSFRTKVPNVTHTDSLATVLEANPDAQVLSEYEGIGRCLSVSDRTTVVIGPEGGWSNREAEEIGERAVTLGPRVLRVDTAVASVCALALLGQR